MQVEKSSPFREFPDFCCYEPDALLELEPFEFLKHFIVNQSPSLNNVDAVQDWAVIDGWRSLLRGWQLYGKLLVLGVEHHDLFYDFDKDSTGEFKHVLVHGLEHI